MRLTLVQSLPKGEKIDLILQKCTEIGVTEFVIVETSRAVPRIAPDRMPGKLERWRAIVREAAEQSGRTRVPDVAGILPFKEALKRIEGRGTGIIAWEEEKGLSLTSMIPRLKGSGEVVILVGPEGGFAPEEVSAAKSAGIAPVSLGPRILRTETAAIVGSALIIYGLDG